MVFSLSGIGYAALGLLLFALSPLFLRLGARRLAPAVGALAFSLALLPAAFLNLLWSGAALSLPSGDLLPALGAGLALAACLLCFFRAAAAGQVLHALPLFRLNFLLAALWQLFMAGRAFNLFSAVYLLLFLLGALLTVSGQGRFRDRRFLPFAILSGLLFFGFGRLFSLLTPGSSMLLSLGACTLLLLLACLLGGSFRGRLRFEQLLFSLAGGGAAAAGVFACCLAAAAGFSPLEPAISLFSLPIALLLARLCLKERASGLYGLGLLLMLSGLAAFLFQFR